MLRLSSPRERLTLPYQRIASPTEAHVLSFPKGGLSAFAFSSGSLRLGKEGWIGLEGELLALLPSSSSREAHIFQFHKQRAQWAFSMRIQLWQPNMPELSTIALVPESHPDFGGCVLATADRSCELFLFGAQQGHPPGVTSVPLSLKRLPIPEVRFGDRPVFYSVSVDSENADQPGLDHPELLVVHASYPGAPITCTALKIRSDVAVVAATFDLPIQAPLPAFAAWCRMPEPAGGDALGIVFPFGTDAHEGLIWAPFEAIQIRPFCLEQCRILRIAGAADRSFRAAAVRRVEGDQGEKNLIWVAGSETGRLYAFDLGAFGPFVPNVKNVSLFALWGPPRLYLLSWGVGSTEGGEPCADGIDPSQNWTVGAYCDGYLLPPGGQEARSTCMALSAVLPGSKLRVVAFREASPGVIESSTFAACIEVPDEEGWSLVRLSPGSLFVTALGFDRESEDILVGDAAGGLFTIPLAPVRELLDEGVRGGAGVSEIQPAPFEAVEGLGLGRLSHISACAVGPAARFLACDGWDHTLVDQGRLVSLDSLAPKGHKHKAFLSGMTVFGATGVDNPGRVVFADATGGRLLELDPGSERLSVLEGALPLEGLFPGHPAAAPAGGPFGVAALGRELLFLWRHPASGELILWSARGGDDGRLSPARPREIVPLPAGHVITGLAVAEARDGGTYVLVSGNDGVGPFLVGKRIKEETSAVLYGERMLLSSGKPARRGPFGCPALDGQRYSLVVSRFDVTGQDVPAELSITVSLPGGLCLPLGPCRLAFADLLVLPIFSPGPIELTIEANAEAGGTCGVVVELTASGQGHACFYEDYPFLRGDVNLSGKVDLADPISLLSHLFARGASPRCLDAADVDDTGRITIGDAIALLFELFGGPHVIAPPFRACGLDPTPDKLPPCAFESPCSTVR